MYSVVPARRRDVPFLAEIEKAAATLLEGHAPAAVLNETTDEADLRAAQAEGGLWVALAGDTPVGFALMEPLGDGTVHLEEIDVHPDHGRRGLGRALVLAACDWAARSGYAAVTLTTFTDLPWNMPFYARLGFEVVAEEELTERLRALVLDETARGLDPRRRVVMRRRISPSPTVAGS
jgi:GNAT superfamily N-acetyltransferase